MTDKVMVLVEGKDDKDFYSNLSNETKVFYMDLGGCTDIEQITREASRMYRRRLAAIKDSDFSRLNGTRSPLRNLFYTDYHDVEMYVATRSRVFEISRGSIHRLENSKAIGIYDRAKNAIWKYSYIKWHNSQRPVGTRLSFKETKVAHHYDKSLLESITVINSLQQNSLAVANDATITAFMNANPAPSERQLLNGHDFCTAIAIAIKEVRMHNIKDKSIFKELSGLFSKAEFERTELCQSLKNYFAPIDIFN